MSSFVKKWIYYSHICTNYTIFVCVFVQLLCIFEKTVDNTDIFGIIIIVPVYNVFSVHKLLRLKKTKKGQDGMQTNMGVNQKINSLVLAVKQNDTASFLELLGHFSHTISALARSFSLPSSEHEDLCQEARMALYRAALSYDEKSAQFSTYAITCMTNAMISFSKKYKAQNLGKAYGVSPEDFEGEAFTEAVSSVELYEMLSRDGFAGLSEYERRVMSMKLSGYKVREIAKKLGKQSKSVENTLFRARQKLKKHIDG